MKVDKCSFLHTLTQLALFVYLLARAASYYFFAKGRKQMPENTKNKELLEFLDLILDGLQVVVDANADGTIDIKDLPLLMKLVPDLGPAFSNIGAIPGELAAMDAEGAAAAVAHVMEKLAITDAHARLVIDTALKAVAANYALVKALKDPKAV